MMTQAKRTKNPDTQDAANIRRQLRSELNTRFLRNLPVFKAERDTPKNWDSLLDRLDQAEKSRRFS